MLIIFVCNKIKCYFSKVCRTSIRGTCCRTLARHLPRIQPLLSVCHGNIPVIGSTSNNAMRSSREPRTIGMRQFRTPSPPLSPPSPVPLVPRLKGRLSSQPSLLSSPSEEYLVPGPLPSRLLSLNQRADGGVRRFLHVPELRGDPHPWTAQWRDPGDRCKRAKRALIRVSPRRSCRAPS